PCLGVTASACFVAVNHHLVGDDGEFAERDRDRVFELAVEAGGKFDQVVGGGGGVRLLDRRPQRAFAGHRGFADFPADAFVVFVGGAVDFVGNGRGRSRKSEGEQGSEKRQGDAAAEGHGRDPIPP